MNFFLFRVFFFQRPCQNEERLAVDDDGAPATPVDGNGENITAAHMKPITFENLRRLIGGRRKNKDRNESPFKRSDSFKRISIRRNYLESRGGGGGQKGRNPTKKPPPPPVTDDPQRRPSSENSAGKTAGSLQSSPPPASAPCSLPVTSRQSVPAKPPDCPLPDPPRDAVPPPPPPAERKRRVVTPVPSPPTVTTVAETAANITAAAAAPVIDYGEWIRCIRAEEDLNNLKRSCSPPTPPARYRYKELDDSSRTDSAISLGRIWMDAPMLPPAAPRSLELPGRPVTTADGDAQQRRAHHSLESALKDKRDDRPVPSRRFHRYPVATAVVDKTASRSSVASTCSGKDSGFSLSAPGLSDPPTRPSKQLFRKKLPSRRPAAVTSASSKPASLLPAAAPAQDKLYRVVVSRSPLRQLKLDPMIFVPPEKRRTTSVQHHQHHHPRPSRPVVEIRDYCVPKDARLQHRSRCNGYDNNDDDGDYNYDDDDEQDRLYESISKGSRRWQDSTDDADTEDDVQHRHQYQYQHQHQHRSSESSAVRNRVKRKKSARRNIKYVVKPVRRAPSAASRKPSVAAKSKSSWITSSRSSCPPLDGIIC